MEINQLRVWHWALIGILVGALFAFSYGSVEWGKTDQSVTSVDFQSMLLNVEPRANNMPVLQDIVVYQEKEKQRLVRYLGMRRVQGQTTATMDARYFYAATPYKVEYSNGTKYDRKNPAPDIMTYLAAVQKANSKFTYKYRWWMEGMTWYGICMGAGLVLIGGVWPLTIRLLVGAGLSPEPESEYDKKWRTHKASKGSADPVATSGASIAEMDQLDQLNSSLEQSVAAGGVAMTEKKEPDKAQEKAMEAGVRKLIIAPLEKAPEPINPEEPKDYQGEFYPVARPHEKKNEKK